jgi:hypothetical protein
MRTPSIAHLARACLAIGLAIGIQLVTALVAVGASGGSDWLRRLLLN